MQVRDFKIRCSAIGKIMTNPRSKSETISKTAMTYLQDHIKEQLYATRKEISSKYLDKGNICEDASIEFIADQLGYGMLTKNENSFESEHMTGTPDIITSTSIIDVKNSWDCFTFPLFDDKIPNKDYWWQGQGYMALTGKSCFRLIYVLSDTPEHIIETEAFYASKKAGEMDLDHDIFDEYLDRMTYKGVDPSIKIKIFDVERDDDAINDIIERVELLREVQNELIKKINCAHVL